MAYFHKNLTQESWNSLPKDKQILNIASELMRAKNMLKKNNSEYFLNSLNRSLELVDLSINDRDKWQGGRLRELLRFREYSANFYFEEKRSLEDFLKLIKSLLLFHPESAKVEI